MHSIHSTRAFQYVVVIVTVFLFIAAFPIRNSNRSTTAAQEQKLSASLQSAEKALERVEFLQRKNKTALESERAATDIYSFEQQLENAAAEIDALLKTEPNNVPALMMAARVGRVLMGIPRKSAPIAGPDAMQKLTDLERRNREEVNRLHSFCERAIALEPGNAEAHYWNAVLYGMMASAFYFDQEQRSFNDLANAIRFAQQAVKLAPMNMVYREALAGYLLQNNQEKDAGEAVGEVTGWTHPINRLLKDRDAIPLPPGAVFMKEQTELDVGFIGEPWNLEYPSLRFHTYLLPMSAAEAEAFWRQKWPGFRLVPKKNKYEREASFVQWMRWRGDDLYPARSAGDIFNSRVIDKGIILDLREYPGPDPENPLPVPVSGVYCIIDIHNFRSL
jgi:tetratricopeptide (TPR) repeat protein